ncbi:MAG TPA: 3D domain-containing protein, partial [Chloroflexota bacterium]|nr:3D domain-containing protein [Chloroflexota bacterium]
AEADVLLGPLDRVEPAADEAVPAHGTVRVVRVREEEQIESRLIPFKTQTQYSNDLAPGARYRLRAGTPGLIERSTKVVLEDGVEVRRSVAAETLVRDVVDEVYVAGRTPRPPVSLPDLALPAVPLAPGLPADLPVKRVMNMVATAYDPGPISTGKSPGHPAYGITATGMRATHGVVAVDPRVIPFYTRLYIPGYGYAVAADTGGAIIGNRIDLFYPTYHEAVQWGRRTVQVYILE